MFISVKTAGRHIFCGNPAQKQPLREAAVLFNLDYVFFDNNDHYVERIYSIPAKANNDSSSP